LVSYIDDQATNLSQQLIKLYQCYFSVQKIRPAIHFELEGSVEFSPNSSQKINFLTLNKELSHRGILGEVKTEYWHNQWEYVSKFSGQTPLKEAHDLAQVLKLLPLLFAQQGVIKTHIRPVSWDGDKGRLAPGCDNIFNLSSQVVHIPNAIQLNISAFDQNNKNLLPNRDFGELLQAEFLHSSYACSLLFMPEEEAFTRIELKNTYGLEQELSSPNDISGGHQGSIALYKQKGKHNQTLGVEPLVVDHQNKPLVSLHNWQQGARVEHRLGAASQAYDPFANVLFGLVNLAKAWQKRQIGISQSTIAQSKYKQLPTSLYNNQQDIGAIELFAQDQWLPSAINDMQKHAETFKATDIKSLPDRAGSIFQQAFLKRYRKKIAI